MLHTSRLVHRTLHRLSLLANLRTCIANTGRASVAPFHKCCIRALQLRCRRCMLDTSDYPVVRSRPCILIHTLKPISGTVAPASSVPISTTPVFVGTIAATAASWPLVTPLLLLPPSPLLLATVWPLPSRTSLAWSLACTARAAGSAATLFAAAGTGNGAATLFAAIAGRFSLRESGVRTLRFAHIECSYAVEIGIVGLLQALRVHRTSLK